MASFLQNVINALQAGSFYALIALGYSMVYSVLMLFNFAHGDIFMSGAYIGFFISSGLFQLPWRGGCRFPIGSSWRSRSSWPCSPLRSWG